MSFLERFQAKIERSIESLTPGARVWIMLALISALIIVILELREIYESEPQDARKKSWWGFARWLGKKVAVTFS